MTRLILIKIGFITYGLVLLYSGALLGYNQQNPPQRIISLGPSITEQLYLLGVEDRLVGCTVYCKRPKEAESKEKVGTVIEVNLEKIASLKPDLVVATSLTDPRVVERLKKLGIKGVGFSQAKNFAEICQQFLELGGLVGKEKEAQEIVNIAKNKVDSIKEKIRGLQPKVLVQMGAKPLWVATKDSFINDFIELAGGENIGPLGRSGLYSREKVLKQNPDVIIIVAMGIVGEQEKKIWERYETLKAVKDKRIYIIDSYKLCSPTPVSFVETLEEMIKILYPQEETLM